jgi:hypothetical protein
MLNSLFSAPILWILPVPSVKTSKWKMKDDNKKKVYSAIGNWYQNFVIVHLQIFEQYITKDAGKAACAFLHNWQLGA